MDETIRKVLLTECCESSIIMLPVFSLVCEENSQRIFSILSALEQEPQADVYVNNYFEQIVPCYSNATYKSHFRMTRTTMNVSFFMHIFK